jgi:branched-chain amino acid aminotransferase
MATLVNINGKILPEEKACVSVFDRGFLFGDSVFEVLRTYGGRLFAFDPHMDRLENSARMISFKLPISREAAYREISRTVKKAGNRECYIRIIATRGAGKIVMDPSFAINPQTVIIVQDFEPPPEDLKRRAVAAALVDIRRNSAEAMAPSIKSGNYLNSVLAQIEAKASGAKEAIMLNAKGNVAEGTVFNVFMAKAGKVFTPPIEAGILDGITRKLIIRHALESGIRIAEANFNTAKLMSADEVFFTSTLREVQPVAKIGDRIIGDGKTWPVTARMLEIFRNALPHYLS